MHKKKGDTLIEVALAIGIFSLVAIVVVSVISASTSSAQASLELTITREELDAQAEALRFIHDSYVADTQSKNVTENKYAKLWNSITERAQDPKDEYINYTPTTCSELYDTAFPGFMKKDSENIKKPFIINTRQISSLDPKEVIVATGNEDSEGPFYEATTYPRILYGNSLGSAKEDLYSQTEDSETTIKRVEGIYITAIKGTSQIVTNKGTEENGIETSVIPKIAYYDFYIHSCWMPPGSERASTISTVVRLYDPAVIVYY